MVEVVGRGGDGWGCTVCEDSSGRLLEKMMKYSLETGQRKGKRVKFRSTCPWPKSRDSFQDS